MSFTGVSAFVLWKNAFFILLLSANPSACAFLLQLFWIGWLPRLDVTWAEWEFIDGWSKMTKQSPLSNCVSRGCRLPLIEFNWMTSLWLLPLIVSFLLMMYTFEFSANLPFSSFITLRTGEFWTYIFVLLLQLLLLLLLLLQLLLFTRLIGTPGGWWDMWAGDEEVVVVTWSVIELLLDTELLMTVDWNSSLPFEWDGLVSLVLILADCIDGGPFESKLDIQLVVLEEFFPLSILDGPDRSDVFPLSRLDGPLWINRKCRSRSLLIFSSNRGLIRWLCWLGGRFSPAFSIPFNLDFIFLPWLDEFTEWTDLGRLPE